MRGSAVWAIGIGLSLWLMAGFAQAQCTKDTDCKGDRVCESGTCMWQAPPTVAAPTTVAAPADDDVQPPTDDDVQPPAAAPTQASLPAPTSPPARVAVPPVREAQSAPEAALAPVDAPPPPRQSRAAMAAGIIMVSLGPIALLGTLTAKSSLDGCVQKLGRDYPDRVLPTSQRDRLEECDGYSVTAYALGIGGAVLTLAGIPLIAYGARRVPQRAPAAKLQLAPWATHESGGLKLRLTL